MKRVILMVCIVPVMLFGEDMSTLFEKVEQSNLYKQYTQSINAQQSLLKADNSYDGWSVGTDIGYADVKNGLDSGMEYGFNIGKEFSLTSSSINSVLRSSQSYTDVQKKVKYNRLQVDIFHIYALSCMTLEVLKSKKELTKIYISLSLQIEQGVRFGEFDASKAIMANLSKENLTLEVATLESQLESYKAQINSMVPFDGTFTCQSVEVNTDYLFNIDNSGYSKMLEEKRNLSQSQVGLASKEIRSIYTNASYMDELDTKRYMLNLSVPLSFGNTKREASIVSAMSKNSALNYEMKVFTTRHIHETRALKKQLYIYNKYLVSTEDRMKESADTLIKQSNLRFKAGEESFIALLKATQTKLQMIETILNLKLKRHQAIYGYLYTYAINPQGVIND